MRQSHITHTISNCAGTGDLSKVNDTDRIAQNFPIHICCGVDNRYFISWAMDLINKSNAFSDNFSFWARTFLHNN